MQQPPSRQLTSEALLYHPGIGKTTDAVIFVNDKEHECIFLYALSGKQDSRKRSGWGTSLGSLSGEKEKDQ